MRYCSDIAMFAVDRPVTSCIHCTSFCVKNCYNRKLYRIYKAMSSKDVDNEQDWNGDIAKLVQSQLAKSRRDIGRIRLMTRGEALSTLDDFNRVTDICKAIPDTLVWMPTRAWRTYRVERLLELQKECRNLRILLSLDPTSFEDKEMARLHSFLDAGFSTMFFGDNERSSYTIAGREYTFKKCAKTWQGKKGHCLKCRGGCFSTRQVHIHLKKH